MTSQKLRERVHHDVCAVIDWLDQKWCRQGVVDDEGYAGLAGDARNSFDVRDGAAGIGDRFDEDSLGARADRGFEGCDIVGISQSDIPPEALERMGELIDGAAIKLS